MPEIVHDLPRGNATVRDVGNPVKHPSTPPRQVGQVCRVILASRGEQIVDESVTVTQSVTFWEFIPFSPMVHAMEELARHPVARS